MGEQRAGQPTGARAAAVREPAGATSSVKVEDGVVVARSLAAPASGPARSSYGATCDVAARLLAAPALAEHVPALSRLDVVLRENPRASAGVSVDLTGRPAGSGPGGTVAP